MKFQLPQEPLQRLLDDPRLLWLSQFYRHIRGDTDWIAPSLQNSWVDYGGAYAPAGYRLKNGVVYIQGLIKDGTVTAGTVLFTLPEGYRPASSKIFHSPNGTTDPGRTNIAENGDVTIEVGGNSWHSLEPIRFIAEQ